MPVELILDYLMTPLWTAEVM